MKINYTHRQKKQLVMDKLVHMQISYQSVNALQVVGTPRTGTRSGSRGHRWWHHKSVDSVIR